MSYRIQFTVTDAEYAELKTQAMAEGFPTVAEMCKTKALNGKNTYAELFMEMKKKIEKIKPNEIINDQLNPGEFYLRDIIPTPPALLGRWLYEAVHDGRIPHVEHLGNDGTNPEKYRKTEETV